MTTVQDRVAVARITHRFGLGPRPGEFLAALNAGVAQSATDIQNTSKADPAIDNLPQPLLSNLGLIPGPKDPNRATFRTEMQQQRESAALWWLDRMALTNNPLTERMTWFWHGHWATSVQKVEYAQMMKIQNENLRANALGSFTSMAQAMVIDPALCYWLDADSNIKNSPNENLARELMELFTLGVGNYSEDDVKAAARALTGWRVSRLSYTTTFYPKDHDNSVFTFLGKNASFQAADVVNTILNQSANQTFIPNRLWYRFISTDSTAPSSVVSSFSNREIAPVISSILSSNGITDPQNSQVKSPTEWFISACRALGIQPSTLSKPNQALNLLNQMGQVPFEPPNVGGWPADGAWLNAAATQFRLFFAYSLVSQGDISPIKNSSSMSLPQDLADWLGVAQWSARTAAALSDRSLTSAQVVRLALCSPEYLVSA